MRPKFRETLWFKKGEKDAQVAAETDPHDTMAPKAAEAAHFGEARIVIHAHFQVRIAHRRRVQLELVCEAEHAGIARQLHRGEMEITVRRRLRHARRIHRAQVADEPPQAHEITLIQRHQADKTARLRSPRCPTPLIR